MIFEHGRLVPLLTVGRHSEVIVLFYEALTYQIQLFFCCLLFTISYQRKGDKIPCSSRVSCQIFNTFKALSHFLKRVQGLPCQDHLVNSPFFRLLLSSKALPHSMKRNYFVLIFLFRKHFSIKEILPTISTWYELHCSSSPLLLVPHPTAMGKLRRWVE